VVVAGAGCLEGGWKVNEYPCRFDITALGKDGCSRPSTWFALGNEATYGHLCGGCYALLPEAERRLYGDARAASFDASLDLWSGAVTFYGPLIDRRHLAGVLRLLERTAARVREDAFDPEVRNIAKMTVEGSERMEPALALQAFLASDAKWVPDPISMEYEASAHVLLTRAAEGLEHEERCRLFASLAESVGIVTRIGARGYGETTMLQTFFVSWWDKKTGVWKSPSFCDPLPTTPPLTAELSLLVVRAKDLRRSGQ